MNSLLHKGLRFHYLIGCLLLAATVTASVTFAQEPVNGDVLILHSYHQGYGWTDDVQVGIFEALNSKNLNLETHTEYMYTKRF